MNLLLADRYGEGRVFLAGDAVHLVIPTGGLGMKPASATRSTCRGSSRRPAGWGGPNLLASYEIERRQVGARNVAASGFATLGRRQWRAALSAGNPRAIRRRRRDARRAGARGRRRAAQGDRNDRRRARLSLCRFAAHRFRAGGGARARFHGVRSDHVARRAAAARVARATAARCRTASVTATATRCCDSAARKPIPARCSGRSPRRCAACRSSTFRTSAARRLWIRSPAAAARHARGLARQRRTAEPETGGAGDRALRRLPSRWCRRRSESPRR